MPAAIFVIGLEGQIVQCIPLNEIAYASNGRNYDTYPLSAVIREKMESLTIQPIRRLLNWFRICV